MPAEYIQREVKRASFDLAELQAFAYGGKDKFEAVKRWEAIIDADPIFDVSKDAFLSREEQMRLGVKRSMAMYRHLKKHKDMLAAHSPLHGDGGLPAARMSSNHSGITDHYALFVQTILAQGTPEQVREWLPKALNLEIIGTYAQTELGHGSNVRGLETIAKYDTATDEFVIDMPKITAMKWWPGALGLLCTHAVVYARLIVDDKDYGFNAFVVQIRNAQHEPMPGVEVGDIGPKMGCPALDSGYLYLRNVRVPRFNMLAKFQRLEKGGKYSQAPAHLAKIAYVTMMKARVAIVYGAGGKLAKGAQVVVRYNAFRKQGFIDSKKGIPGGERVILDYQVQQHRIFPQVATAFAIFFASRFVTNLLNTFDAAVKAAGKDIDKIDTSMLPELHATSAGLKAFTTEMTANGLEEMRKCCGGQGYALSSGIAQMVVDYMPSVTYEGDRFPMALQTARVMLGALAGKVPRTGSMAYLGGRGTTSLKRGDDLPHLVAVWESIARNSATAVGLQLMSFSKKTNSADAWNSCHVQLISTAYAHTIYRMLFCFMDGIKDAPAKAKPVMANLALLFGLTRLGELTVHQSKLTPKQAALIDDSVKRLLAALRPEIVAVCEVFGFSDRQLHSEIARSDTDDIYGSVLKWAKESPLNEPAYAKGVHTDVLSPFLNKEYLAKGQAATAKL